MILGGSNSGVSIAMSKVAKEKKVPFIAIGAAGASLTSNDCTAYSSITDTTPSRWPTAPLRRLFRAAARSGSS